jgi:polygalacturonase
MGNPLLPSSTPVFTGATYNITSYGASTTNTAATNATDIQNAINAASADPNGGIVQIPTGVFLSNTLTLGSNVDLNLASGAVLRDGTYTNSLIITTGNAQSNDEISGSGIIDGNATTKTGSNKLVNLTKISTLEITGVSIENAAQEHLVVETSSNVTINGITIADPATLAANGGNYLGNTDGLDFNGSQFLIENSNFADGDDDIVAKTSSGSVSNATILNNTITAGHGISIGGGTVFGLNNMLVNNDNISNTLFGIHLKAEDAAGSDGGGGSATPVQNVTYENITMNNVSNPILLDDFYNGNDHFPASPVPPSSSYPSTPTAPDSTTPYWENILFSNMTITNAGNGGEIAGLNTTSPNLFGLTFNNVNISAASHMDLWYAGSLNLSGLTVTVPNTDPYANASPVPGVYLYGTSNVVVPEPATLAFATTVAGLCLRRRRAQPLAA